MASDDDYKTEEYLPSTVDIDGAGGAASLMTPREDVGCTRHLVEQTSDI
jgi:hypothetical protein